jgi:hypothetical protein
MLPLPPRREIVLSGKVRIATPINPNLITYNVFNKVFMKRPLPRRKPEVIARTNLA